MCGCCVAFIPCKKKKLVIRGAHRGREKVQAHQPIVYRGSSRQRERHNAYMQRHPCLIPWKIIYAEPLFVHAYACCVCFWRWRWEKRRCNSLSSTFFFPFIASFFGAQLLGFVWCVFVCVMRSCLVPCNCIKASLDLCHSHHVYVFIYEQVIKHM